jgi:hypothetical protein
MRWKLVDVLDAIVFGVPEFLAVQLVLACGPSAVPLLYAVADGSMVWRKSLVWLLNLETADGKSTG